MSGNLPAGWTVAKLGDLFEVLDRHRVPINEQERSARLARSPERFPYFGATGQVGEIDQFLFEGESVLLGEDGAPFLEPARRKAYLVSGRYWVNNHAHILRAHSPHSNAFFCHQLNAIAYAPHVSGTTRLKLTQAAMVEIELRVAPALEQQRIVSRIEELFSEIDEGERALERVGLLVERYRQSVLKAAVTGELTQSTPVGTGAEERLAALLEARRAVWRANEGSGRYPEPGELSGQHDLPSLPPGWAWACIDQVGLVSGGLTKNRDRAERELRRPYLRVANVYANRLNLDEVQEIGVSEAELPRVTLKPADLLVVEGNGSVDQIGRVALWDGSIPGCVHQNHIIKVRCTDLLPSWYVLVWCLSPLGRAHIERVASSSSGLHTLSISKIQSLPIPVPPVEALERIKDEFDRMDAAMASVRASLAAESARATALRQSILKAAFAGQLVPQDPSYEPASALLARLAAQAAEAPAAPKRRGRQVPA